MPSFPVLDLISFIAGFAAASIFWLLISRLFRWLPKAIAKFKLQQEETAQKKAAGLRTKICEVIYRQAQSLHASSDIFALNEICLEPRVLACPAIPEPGQLVGLDHLTSKLIPFTPDFPEISAYYSLPTLSMAETASGGCNLALIGSLGSGKTTALAHFTSLIARSDPAAGKFIDYIPLYVRISDLAPKIKEKVPALDRLLLVIQAQLPSALKQPFLAYIHRRIKAGKVILLIDGLDALPVSEFDEAVGWIEEIIKSEPTLQCIVTAGPNYLDGLIDLGLQPVALQAWDQDQRLRFSETWCMQWNKSFVPLLKQPFPEVSPRLISEWQREIEPQATPLELTLLLRQILSGEYNPSQHPSSIYQYVFSLFSEEDALQALAHLAAQMVADQESSISLSAAEKIINRAIQAQKSLSAEEPVDSSGSNEKTRKRPARISSASKLLNIAIETGILAASAHDRLEFSHPLIFAYLAGSVPQTLAEVNVIGHLRWPVEEQAFQFAQQNRLLTNPLAILSEEDKPLIRNLQSAARWNAASMSSDAWFAPIFRLVVSAVEDDTLPFSLRLKLLTRAVAGSRMPLSSMLRNWLASESRDLRRLAVLGCGISQDEKLIKDILGLFTDSDPEVRYSAGLSITAFHSENAQKILVELFLHGEEPLRQIAAETFASGRFQGFEILKEAVTYEDILTRRAAVLGLSAVKTQWSIQILEKISVEDSQWVVRNVAGHGLEQMNLPSPYIPRPLTKAHEAEWLIKFAAQQGQGIKKGEFPLGLLLQAVRTGSSDEQIAALQYLARTPNESVYSSLYPLAMSENQTLRESAYTSLWMHGLRGKPLPAPTVYGLG